PLVRRQRQMCIRDSPKTIFKEGALQQTKSWYALADVLGLDRQGLINKIKKNEKRRFIYLQRQVSPAMANYCLLYTSPSPRDN
ncbi:hypothetical protein, partial [Vibrio harveyi]|uniref:hypothetical protein n=1 Tax=Vibrio harveyi TaxID=669 RepID=UPI0018F1CC33